jgi:tetratricopeptide (TPR) repeat protein
MARQYAGHPELAVPHYQAALARFAGRREVIDLLVSATQNLVHCYLDLGYPHQAYELFTHAEPQFQECRDELAALRIDWLRGKIERDMGLHGAALIRLERVRWHYMHRDLTIEVAMVSLDLAEIYAAQGRYADLTRTVGETVPLFRALGVERELIAALLRLREITTSRQATATLARQIARRLQNVLAQAGH